MKKALIITGQTGTGKTARAIQEAQRISGEILNADARQIYRYLTIVTGKDISSSVFIKIEDIPIDQERLAAIGYYTIDGIRVWGYDLIDPSTHFSSFDYKVVANHIVRNAISESATPIIVGGTHLYVKHITQNFNIDVPPNWQLREQLEKLSIAELQKKLMYIDESTFSTMNASDQLNPRRLIRKIEIASHINTSVTKKRKPLFEPIPYYKKIGLAFSSTELCRDVIARRIESRLEAGALDEVKRVLQLGYTSADPGLKAIGYKELISYIEGATTLDEAKKAWLTAEVQYAKRQHSFMKQDQEIEWEMV